MCDNSSELTPVVSANKKRDLTSPDSPPDQKKNRFYTSPVTAGIATESGMSQQSGDTSGEEFWMDTDGTTGGVAVSTGDKQLHVQQGSQQPNLNITIKEGDLKGISVILKESFCGELKDEMPWRWV